MHERGELSLPVKATDRGLVAGIMFSGLIMGGNSIGHRPVETIASAGVMVAFGLIRNYVVNRAEQKTN